jgi:hypothetical protein
MIKMNDDDYAMKMSIQTTMTTLKMTKLMLADHDVDDETDGDDYAADDYEDAYDDDYDNDDDDDDDDDGDDDNDDDGDGDDDDDEDDNNDDDDDDQLVQVPAWSTATTELAGLVFTFSLMLISGSHLIKSLSIYVLKKLRSISQCEEFD